MGAGNKLLFPFAGTTLVDHVVRTICRAQTGEVIVVLGHEADRVRAALSTHTAILVRNGRYPEGMTTSIQTGVRAASDTDGYMICLSDLPLIEPDEFNRLLAAFDQAVQVDGRCIVVPVFEGRRGNPVLFAASYKPAILAEREAEGCKAIVRQHAAHVLEVPMPTDHILHDIDTMAAYQQLQGRM